MTVKQTALIDDRPMMPLQLYTLFICFIMNMLDGMDVLVISYAAPSIAKDWAISPTSLGAVFSSGLFGMAIGTMFLAPLADKIGRKNIILINGAIMGVCIYLTSFAQNIQQLMILRFVSGLGIGSMLASTAALAAEYTPNKSRDFWVSLVIAGYPVGAVLSGLVAAEVIPASGWQQMFKIAGIASLVTLPLVQLLLSESIDFYLQTQPKNALSKLNIILQKLNLPRVESLPQISKIKSKIPVAALLSGTNRKSTLQLWLSLFMAFAALYFLSSWIPKLAKDAGLSIELAIYAGTIFNVGAFFGILTQGYFSSKYGLKKTIGTILILTACLMASFKLFVGTDWVLLVFAFLGFGIQGGFVGLYAVAARMYPAAIRTTGVGWAMGSGRIGGIVGPFLAGILLTAGFTIGTNFMIFAIPALLAGLITYKIDSDTIS